MIVPRLPLTWLPNGEARSAFGSPNWGWLNRLKNSARKSAPTRSVTLKRLMSEKSVFTKPGPESGVREAVPNSPTGAWVKQAGLNHRWGVWLILVGLQVWIGRLLVAKLSSKFTPDSLTLLTMKTGNPEVIFSITVACQPPRAALIGPLQPPPKALPLPKGRS